MMENDGNKPTYMLLRLGGGKENDKKGFFKNLFRKNKGDGPSDDFKNGSALLGKVAAATNWLTKRFLSTKMRDDAGQHGRGGRRTHTRQASSRGRLHGNHNGGYEYEEDAYGYDQHHSVRQKYGGYDEGYAGYGDEAACGDQGQFGYYDNGAGVANHQDLGYYEEEGFYDANAEFFEDDIYDDGTGEYHNHYPLAQGYYNNQQQQAMAMYGDEGLDYYALMGEDNVYVGEVDGYIDPEAQGYYDENGQVVYYGEGQQGYYDNGQTGYVMDPYAGTMGMQGGLPPDYQLSYSDVGVPYQDYSSQQAFGVPQGGQQVFGYEGQGIDQGQGMYGDQYADQFDQFGDDTGGVQGGELTFRVPRPQVRLFGKERLDVPLHPPPTLPPDPEFEDMSDIQYEDQIPLAQGQYGEMSIQQQMGMSPQQQMMMFPHEQMMMPQQMSPQQQMMSPQQQMMLQEEQMMPQQMMSQQQQMMLQQEQMMPQQMMSPQQQMMLQQQQMMLQEEQMAPPQMMSPQQQMMLQHEQMMPQQMMSPQQQMMLQHEQMMPQQMISPQVILAQLYQEGTSLKTT